jgi:hypothetical protein
MVKVWFVEYLIKKQIEFKSIRFFCQEKEFMKQLKSVIPCIYERSTTYMLHVGFVHEIIATVDRIGTSVMCFISLNSNRKTLHRGTKSPLTKLSIHIFSSHEHIVNSHFQQRTFFRDKTRAGLIKYTIVKRLKFQKAITSFDVQTAGVRLERVGRHSTPIVDH